MGQFKQMPKMMTNEPTVILKLKKGGHVASEHKDADGHTNMKGKAFLSARAEEAAEEGSSPKKPSMSDRRKAMSGALLNSKKGGKVVKKADGGAMPAFTPGSAAAADAAAANAARTNAAAKAASAMGGPRRTYADGTSPVGPRPGVARVDHPMAPRVPMNAQGDFVPGRPMPGRGMPVAQPGRGGMPVAQPGNLPAMKKGGKAAAFAKTKMHDGDKTDKAHGTKGVKEGKVGGYKTGGAIGKFVNTKVVDGDHKDTAHGTGGVKEGKPAGYKKGGAIAWENRPANDGDKFDPAHGTTGVKEANAGGYKKGGAAKKHFATGGSVNDAGKSVAMPKHFVSKPVSNTAQSGTFKKGGKVGKFAEGGLEDMSGGAYDKFYEGKTEENEKDRGSMTGLPTAAYAAIKRLLGIKPDAGAGRGNVNPPLARKSGGIAKR